jgi:hypothetical protein
MTTRIQKLLIAILVSVCGASVLCGPALAASAGPGWELTAHTVPTYLAPPVNEVEAVAVDATGGSFTLTFRGSETGALPYNAGDEAVQAALEALPTIGGAGVDVTGGPGDEGATSPYVVTFVGRLAARSVAQLEANSAALTGGTQTATVTVRAEGAGDGTLLLDVFNVGAGASHGPVTVTDVLPDGLTAVEAGGSLTPSSAGELVPEPGQEQWACTGNGPGDAVAGATVVTCSSRFDEFPGGGGPPTSDVLFGQGQNLQPMVAIVVKGAGEASGLINHATIAGGGAPTPASVQDPITISSRTPPFGFVSWDGWFSNADGTLDTQAGSHPYEATFTFDLAEALLRNDAGEPEALLGAGGEPRDIEVRLPPGVVINPLAVAQCTRQALAAEQCPATSQVGIITTYLGGGESSAFTWRLYNVVPPPGVPGEVGFNFEGIRTLFDGAVRTGSDYGITAHINQIAQRHVVSTVTTLWDVPGEASHDRWRGGGFGGCTPEQIVNGEAYCQKQEKPVLTPYLTLPTACGPLAPTSIRADAWQSSSVVSESAYKLHDASGNESQITGCEDLAFGPNLAVGLLTSDADSPTGITLDVKPSLGGLEESGLLGTSDIRRAAGSAPPGFVINPGQAAGLQACGENATEAAIGTAGAAHCPAASKLGTVRIKSPLLEAAAEKELQGDVFLLQSNPPTIHLLVAASADGINLKLVGVARLNTANGQIEAIFGEDHAVEAEDPYLRGHMTLPQLPASDFKLTFEAGPRSAVDTPVQCGTYEIERADFTPWASPFIPDVFANATLPVTAGPGGSTCPPNPAPFAPTLTAGSTDTDAGAFTNFTQLIQRGDGQQRIERFQFTEPAGLSGMISQVPLCPEPQAAQGSCASASRIGRAVVTAGSGSDPLTIPQPGEPEAAIYLTGPYAGAPFGLSIATPIIAGPFNLGTIVTRAKIEVDPRTAQITITTDPLPQIIDGVPTDLRSIYVLIDRPGFLFNPTNCNPQEFKGDATSAGGAASAPLSTRFAVGACRALKFAPKFAVSTSGKTSKAGGASLTTKLAIPGEPQGTQANIATVKVELPKQLPSRLTTLQKACPAAQFEANPAGCPAASVIGHATVHTPVLPVPLTGPAYFVSHGNEAFPSLTMVLQGYGVTIEVVGATLIRKGITSTTFKTVPDVPFNDFELTLPQGPFSALAANGNLCASELTMPIEYQAQSGAVLSQRTPITVQNCTKAIAIVSRSVKNRTAHLTVAVPGAGRLTARGKGLSRASKISKGRERLRLTLRERGRQGLKTRVNLRFVPRNGKPQQLSVGLRFSH